MNISGKDMVKSCLIIHWRKLQSLAVEHYALKEILIFMERVDSGRQASMVSDIMDCQRGKMHRSFCVKNLYLVILYGITGEYATPEGYLVDEQEAVEFDKHVSI